MTTLRPKTITLAAILLALLSVIGLMPFPLAPGIDEIPAIVVYSSYVLGALGLVAVAGLWLLKKWGVWLTLLVSVVSIVSAAPGIVFAPTTTLWIIATLSVVLYAAVIALVFLPQSRRVYV